MRRPGAGRLKEWMIINRPIPRGQRLARNVAQAWAILIGLSAVLAMAGPAAARVPQGFVGMMADGPIFSSGVNLPAQLDRMVASGVESVRVVFSWAQAEPYPDLSAVPAPLLGEFTNSPAGAPTDFTATDRIVGLAAQRGMSVLPVPMYAPAWDVVAVGPRGQANPNLPIQPRLTGPYAHYLTALVGRYGPHGSFWSENPQIPRMPIRRWQIWNEPNLSYFWSSAPFAASYVQLLRAGHDAIKRADPGAQVIMAGLANYSWISLERIYQINGAGSLFDAVAVHPYTATAAGVLKIVKLVRRVMDRSGDHGKPILVTELGWPSALGRTSKTFGLATTRRGQAQRLAEAIPMLAAARGRLGIAGFDVYTWVGTESGRSNTFNYSGLFAFSPGTGTIQAKPAYSAFRTAALAIEGCRVKAAIASRCRTAG